MNRTRVIAAVAWLAMIVVLVVVVDRVAMHTWLEDERLFLEDIPHRPKPDYVEFNEHGVRDVRRLSAFRESDFNIIVLGDSFVFGFLLKPYQAIPQQMQRRLRERYPERSINVVNFGYVSASPYLSLRQLQDFGREYHPDLVLLCIDMTDFHDDIKYEHYDRKPGLFALLDVWPSGFFALKGAAKRLGLHEWLFGYPSDRFFVVNRPLEESRPYLDAILGNIAEIARFTREELGAKFALLVFPRPFQYSAEESVNSWEADLYTPLGPWVLEPFRFFDELGPTDYPRGSLLQAFRDTDVFPTAFRADPHWNAAGARVAVDAILAFLDRYGLVGGEPEPGATPDTKR